MMFTIGRGRWQPGQRAILHWCKALLWVPQRLHLVSVSQGVLDILHPNAAHDVSGAAGAILEGAGGTSLVGQVSGGGMPTLAVPLQLRYAACQMHPTSPSACGNAW